MIEPIIPDGQALIARIKRHLEDRPGDERMVLLWLGFVAGLSEFGMLDRKVTREIQVDVLPNIGGDQLGEIYLGTRAEQAEDQELIRKREEREEQERAQRLAEREAKKAATAKAGS
jgi:hypothetical protein